MLSVSSLKGQQEHPQKKSMLINGVHTTGLPYGKIDPFLSEKPGYS